jgi:alpha-D-ribose 1-methylphosphonate 5-triphosphate diphosphatase
MKLGDRGEIALGRRADLAIVNQSTRQVEGTLVGGRWSYLAGGLAQRLTSGEAARERLAAE